MVSIANFLFPFKALTSKGGRKGRDEAHVTVLNAKGASRRWRLKSAIDPKSSLPSFHWMRIRSAK